MNTRSCPSCCTTSSFTIGSTSSTWSAQSWHAAGCSSCRQCSSAAWEVVHFYMGIETSRNGLLRNPELRRYVADHFSRDPAVKTVHAQKAATGRDAKGRGRGRRFLGAVEGSRCRLLVRCFVDWVHHWESSQKSCGHVGQDGTLLDGPMVTFLPSLWSC